MAYWALVGSRVELFSCLLGFFLSKWMISLHKPLRPLRRKYRLIAHLLSTPHRHDKYGQIFKNCPIFPKELNEPEIFSPNNHLPSLRAPRYKGRNSCYALCCPFWSKGAILVMLFAAPFDPRVWEPEGEGQAEPESPFLTLSYKFAASATYSLI